MLTPCEKEARAHCYTEESPVQQTSKKEFQLNLSPCERESAYITPLKDQ